MAVIGRHMELKRSGRTWKGCCVFHGERTPSFHVYPEDKHFKCYGCGEFGDVFKFLQKLQGKEFPEVVRELAAEVGVQIPEVGEDESAEAMRRRKERNELLAACDAAARYWSARLESRFGADARAYLASRGVSDDSVKAFRIGVASGEWSDLEKRLVAKGVGKAALRAAGLLVDAKDGDRTYDRFRSRLMFPIAAMDGQPIGFGGRALGEEKGAKYINTPETPLYKKSKVLYGLDRAREAIRKTRAAVLVEGYFDVIGLHQAGVANAVAVCGTALTPEHVELLKRLDCREVTILFDGDLAGLAAPSKAAAALLPSGMAGKVALLPAEGGKVDPDDFARANGRAGVEKLLASAAPLSQFLIERAVERACGGAGKDAALEAKLAAVREIEPFVRMTPDGLARSVFEDAIARRLDLDPGALRAELETERGPRRPAAAPAGGGAPGTRPAPARPAARTRILGPGPEVDALCVLIAYPELGATAGEESLVALLPAGPLADLARDLVGGAVATDEALVRLQGAVDARTLAWIRERVGPGRPGRELAERELRKAVVKASISAIRAEQDRLLALIAKKGSPVPEELTVSAQVASRRRADLEKRLRSLERPG